MVSAPKPPDPYTTAAAQTNANVNTAAANAMIGNANEVNPYGTVNYAQTGTGYITDSKGNKTSVPQYTRTVALSPEQQQLYNKQNVMQNNLADIGVQQSGKVGSILNTSLNTEGLPDWQQYGNAPTLKTGYAGSGDTEQAFSDDRKRVEDALMARYREQNDPARKAQETSLAARGLSPGSQNWGAVNDAENRQDNDATYNAIAAGGTEQSRLLSEARNSSDFYNTAGMNQFNMDNSAISNNNNLRGQELTERQTLRNAPLNEISALMSGSQVSVPQFSPYNAPNVGNTPIGQYIQDNYNARVQQANATNTGLFGLGSALTGGLFGTGGMFARA
jgi:hypothetical protein